MTLVARDLMQADPLTVPAQASLLDVQHLLVVARISGAPVVDLDGAVIGVITAGDVLRELEQAFDDDIDEGESDDLVERARVITAGEMATPEVIWVSPDTPISHVARRMRTEGVHRVFVGTPDRLAGILTAYDLLQVVA
jgi:CBS domain-containing protein